MERKHWIGLTVAAVAIAASILLTSLPNSTPTRTEPKTATVRGQITLTSTHVHYMTGRLGEDCHGTNQFKDMQAGTRVTVYNQTDTVLGTGALSQGYWYDSCVFAFTVKQVPETGLIQVEVGGHGKVTVSWAEVKAGKVKLQLGP